ncbi:MAG: NAD(P)/FAD-dependent oxidoreductase [Chloroflexi bacterium]|nr:MAG: NAD(P)/FAD-dependent oxidoreductase [Chloroflexota bacterium]TMG51559.1 MAG: NAD(P)/FAD-dependent oxidoreductase [Chloroflexota bacterium]
MSPAKRIVVLGGGFAGLHLVRRLEGHLRHEEASVTLVDRQNYHLFTPLLYQVCTGELPPHAVAYPLRDATAPAGFKFIQSEVTAIDLEHRRVGTADSELAFDHLVIVLGSVTNDYGIPGVHENALPVKWLSDAEALKRHVLDIFESAATETDIARRREQLTFIIVGAGPVGVELASSLRDLMDHTLRRIYPSIDFYADVTIHLLDGADRVIPGMDPRLSRIAMKRLEQQRVRVLLNTLVSEIRPGAVHTKDGAQLRGRTIVWSGGVKVNPLVASLDVPKSKDGRIVVDDHFRVNGRDDVLALGDAAYFESQGKGLPQLAQVAVLEAPAAARNLAALVRGQPTAPFVYHRKGDLIALGRTQAGAEFAKLGGFVLGGFPAWTVWRVNYLMQLLGVRNRASLLIEWILSFFAGRLVANTP